MIPSWLAVNRLDNTGCIKNYPLIKSSLNNNFCYYFSFFQHYVWFRDYCFKWYKIVDNSLFLKTGGRGHSCYGIFRGLEQNVNGSVSTLSLRRASTSYLMLAIKIWAVLINIKSSIQVLKVWICLFYHFTPDWAQSLLLWKLWNMSKLA